MTLTGSSALTCRFDEQEQLPLHYRHQQSGLSAHAMLLGSVAVEEVQPSRVLVLAY
jgi:hypothetical protein